MSSNSIERRSFLKMMAAGAGSAMLPLSFYQKTFANEPSASPIKFKLGKTEWFLHNDGTFDLITDNIRLLNS